MCKREAAAGSSASIAAVTSSFFARASAAMGTLQIATRSDRETRFDDVDAKNRELARQADFLFRVHGKAGRLLTVAKRGVKNAYDVVHGGLPYPSNAKAGLLVKFIFILHLIILPYTAVGGFAVDLGELQVFLMVAKEGSFSRAAERLYRTQPAISLGIRKLEDSLGQPLFVRGSRPVRLTDAGTLLKDYAERLLNLRDEVTKGLTELEGLQRGELSLGVNESSIHALLPALAKFRNAHPGVQVRVHRMFSRDIPHEVLNYRLDVGAISYIPREAQLHATEIVKDELVLVVPLKHPLAKRKEVDIADLGSETFVGHIVESPYRRRVIELFARHRATLNMPIEMPTIESIKRFVQMGMGVAIVPRMCAQWEIEHGWMKEVKVRQMSMPRHVYLVSRRGARLPHAAAELMRILREE
jgi:DNA-binding transcriptional LysR family regulator